MHATGRSFLITLRFSDENYLPANTKLNFSEYRFKSYRTFRQRALYRQRAWYFSFFYFFISIWFDFENPLPVNTKSSFYDLLLERNNRSRQLDLFFSLLSGIFVKNHVIANTNPISKLMVIIHSGIKQMDPLIKLHLWCPRMKNYGNLCWGSQILPYLLMTMFTSLQGKSDLMTLQFDNAFQNNTNSHV